MNSPQKGQWRGAFDVFFDLRLNKRLSKQPLRLSAWWCHQMDTFSALLALCAGNSPVTLHKGQWRGALVSSLICAWINVSVNNTFFPSGSFYIVITWWPNESGHQQSWCWFSSHENYRIMFLRQMSQHIETYIKLSPFSRRHVHIHILEWQYIKFVPKFWISNFPALVQIMAWRRPRDKPISEQMIVSLLAHILVLNELTEALDINGYDVLVD